MLEQLHFVRGCRVGEGTQESDRNVLLCRKEKKLCK